MFFFIFLLNLLTIWGPPVFGGAAQAVEKVKIRQIWYKSLAEFRPQQTTETSLILRGHAPQKNRCSGRKCTSAVSAMQRPAAI